MAYWVKFAGNGAGACVEVEPGQGETEARVLAERLACKEVVAIARLPYPADPRLNRVSMGSYGPSPSFCYRPEECARSGRCTAGISCVE